MTASSKNSTAIGLFKSYKPKLYFFEITEELLTQVEGFSVFDKLSSVASLKDNPKDGEPPLTGIYFKQRSALTVAETQALEQIDTKHQEAQKENKQLLLKMSRELGIGVTQVSDLIGAIVGGEKDNSLSADIISQGIGFLDDILAIDQVLNETIVSSQINTILVCLNDGGRIVVQGRDDITSTCTWEYEDIENLSEPTISILYELFTTGSAPNLVREEGVTTEEKVTTEKKE